MQLNEDRLVTVVCACLQKPAVPLPVAAERPADDVIRIGQDEFHDALEAALESASAASIASAAEAQAEAGGLICYGSESDLFHMFMWMYS